MPLRATAPPSPVAMCRSVGMERGREPTCTIRQQGPHQKVSVRREGCSSRFSAGQKGSGAPKAQPGTLGHPSAPHPPPRTRPA